MMVEWLMPTRSLSPYNEGGGPSPIERIIKVFALPG
jgi:hypothetical protein